MIHFLPFHLPISAPTSATEAEHRFLPSTRSLAGTEGQAPYHKNLLLLKGISVESLLLTGVSVDLTDKDGLIVARV